MFDVGSDLDVDDKLCPIHGLEYVTVRSSGRPTTILVRVHFGHVVSLGSVEFDGVLRQATVLALASGLLFAAS